MGLTLESLKPGDGATKPRKRVGRGHAAGGGKTCGKGHKGQNSRGKGKVHPWFEGGQMPLQRRLPKRGFKNPFRKEYQIVNLSDLVRCEGVEEIDAHVLAEKGLIRNPYAPVKLLGGGDAPGAVKVTVHKASASAQEKIAAAGGQVTLRK